HGWASGNRASDHAIDARPEQMKGHPRSELGQISDGFSVWAPGVGHQVQAGLEYESGGATGDGRAEQAAICQIRDLCRAYECRPGDLAQIADRSRLIAIGEVAHEEVVAVPKRD